jgi:hypothetical protein
MWLRLLYVRFRSYTILNFILGGLLGWAIQESADQLSLLERWIWFFSLVIFLILAFLLVPPLEGWFRRLFSPDIPPMGQKPEPHRGLIVLVSNEETLLNAVEYHRPALQYLLCVVTDFKQSLYERLNSQLQIRGLRVHPVYMHDAYDPTEAATAVANCLTWAMAKGLLKEEIICDVTGGTSIMTVGAVTQCQQEGVAMQVVIATYVDETPRPLHPVLVTLPPAPAK